MNRNTERRPRKLVLCFDGTGNKFHGDDSDSNILKIFRMLDRTADDQYHYYQPGIGTYVSGDLSHTSLKSRLRSWYMKAKDSALGSSFDLHVVGGYRFLMRFYNPGDEIYIFGFSRGAYIARFLAEMLDFVGLLSHGNEEMVRFAWKSFSQWECRRNDDSEKGVEKKKEMYAFMKGFRETFSRPVRRIQFLGLFDTVNSVPRFETAWMERSKFPYTARSSAKVVRHAVSIDERRAKFRQDLMYQSGCSGVKRHRHARQVLHDVHEKYRASRQSLQAAMSSATITGKHGNHHGHDQDRDQDHGQDHDHGHGHGDHDEDEGHRGRGLRLPRLSDVVESGSSSEEIANPAPYRPHSRSVSCDTRLTKDSGSGYSHGRMSGNGDDNDDDDVEQDLTEVWFSGDHADVGGGWDIAPGLKPTSHAPLSWMVREAMRAGLRFDAKKVVAMGCSDVLENQWAPNLLDPAPAQLQSSISAADAPLPPPTLPNIRINSGDETVAAVDTTDNNKADAPAATDATASNDKNSLSTPRAHFHGMHHKAHIAPIHDSLQYGKGLPASTVTSWKIMEYLPFRRMDLQPDGSWKPIRWPLPCGETRDVPDDVLIHGSVLRRMHHDQSYRPGNLIVGGGGRGCRVAPAHYGIGEWECIADEGDPIGELWARKVAKE